MGTAMAILLMGLPKDIRTEMIEWGRKAERDENVANNIKALVEDIGGRIAKSMLDRISDDEPVGFDPDERHQEWFIDRILDPVIMGKIAEEFRKKYGT